VTNTGTAQPPSTSVTLNGANANQISQTNTCVSPIACGQNCTINVVFRPTGAGAKAANLNGNVGGGTQTVALTGTGT